jgi:glycine cleavage system transcriptional repressor
MDGAFAISVVGRDEPGIISEISKVLYELKCNLADTNMSVLNGYFSMLLIAQPIENQAKDHYRYENELRTKLARVSEQFDLIISAHALNSEVPMPAKKAANEKFQNYTVAVYGTDQPGLVHRITAAITKLNSNIIDLRTHFSHRGRPVYSITMEVEPAPGVDRRRFIDTLNPIARELEVEVTVQENAPH